MVASEANPPFVLILLGSAADAEVMQPTLGVLGSLQIPFQTVLLRDLGPFSAPL